MKKVSIVGIGLGPSTLTLEAKEAIEKAEVIFGAPRMIESVKHLCKEEDKSFYPYFLAKDIQETIEGHKASNFVVLVSGDPGFYSLATSLAKALLDYELVFLPGISSVNGFFAKLQMPWQEAVFTSFHGREPNIVDLVRRNRLVFCLTGKNVEEIGERLVKANFPTIKTYVGEDLGSTNEKISEINAKELLFKDFSSLTVLLFENENYDNRVLTGLPDERFLRQDKIPMTKSEVRAVILSKLRLKPDSISYDIGAGTGSVSVEMALSTYLGHVYALEQKKEAIDLIEENLKSFHIGNVSTICSKAPHGLEDLPKPDAVFIGGSGGEIGNIIELLLKKNPKVRIVITAVTLETLSLVLSILKDLDIDREITQINVARNKKLGPYNLMEAQNPINIISFGGQDE